eukprot:5020276-Pleurochrysis_carterae.AAC.1
MRMYAFRMPLFKRSGHLRLCVRIRGCLQTLNLYDLILWNASSRKHAMRSPTSRPVVYAPYCRENRTSTVTPEAAPFKIGAPTSGVVNI